MQRFSQKVIQVVAKIPRGKVLTYSEVAKRAGDQKAARAVGNILNAYYKECMKDKKPTIPCHTYHRLKRYVGSRVS